MMNTDFISKYFPVGAEVEVSQTDPGFQGSWYSGTVMEHTSKVSGRSDSNPPAILVEYKTLMADEDCKRALRETVSPSQLRPVPPKGRRELGTAFAGGDPVDAYLHDGWWEGVITGVLRGDSKYVVFVRGSRDEMEFEGSMLRVHRDWVKGRWVPDFEAEDGGGSAGGGGVGELTTDLEPPLSTEESLQNNIEPPLSNEESKQNTLGHTFSPGDLVEVSNDEEGLKGSWFTATIIKGSNEKTKYLIEYQTLKEENGKDPLREEVDIQNLRPCPPVIGCVDRFEPFERVDAKYNDGWWEGIIRKVLKEDKYSVYFPASDEILKFRQKDLRVHHEWENGKWVVPPKQVFQL